MLPVVTGLAKSPVPLAVVLAHGVAGWSESVRWQYLGLVGAPVGAGGESVGRTLLGMGISADETLYYEDEVRAGRMLVAVPRRHGAADDA